MASYIDQYFSPNKLTSSVGGIQTTTPSTTLKPASTTVPLTSMGITAKSPTTAATQPPTTIPSSQQNVDTNYYMKPGESSADYTARVAQYNATKNSGTQNTGSTGNTGGSPVNTTDSLTYPGLLRTLVNTAQTGTPQVSQAQKNLADALAKQRELESGIAASYGNIESQAIPLQFQQGREQALARQYAGQESAAQGAVTGAQTGLNSAFTGQGQTLGALQQAAGFAQPQLAGFNQQSFNPLTGQFGGGGNLDSALQNVISGLQNHTMSYADAQNALSGYGQGGINALTDWATKNNFNIAQSNTLAGQQGSIGPAFDYAKTAMSNLETAIQGLGALQSTNIPIINQIANSVSGATGVNSQALQAYRGAIAEARSAIQKVLASVQGGTPTDYVGQSNALLPDNATPAQIAAAKSTLETLGSAKQSIYGNPGQANTTQNASSNIYNW